MPTAQTNAKQMHSMRSVGVDISHLGAAGRRLVVVLAAPSHSATATHTHHTPESLFTTGNLIPTDTLAQCKWGERALRPPFSLSSQVHDSDVDGVRGVRGGAEK